MPGNGVTRNLRMCLTNGVGAGILWEACGVVVAHCRQRRRGVLRPADRHRAERRRMARRWGCVRRRVGRSAVGIPAAAGLRRRPQRRLRED